VLVGVAGVVFLIAYVIVKGFDVRVLSGVVLAVLAWASWATLRWGIRNRSAGMYVCEKGIVHRVSDKVTLYPWEDLTEIMQDKVKDGLDENGCPFMNRGTTFLIKRRDGAEWGIDANAVREHLRFMRAVYAASRPYGVRWTLYQG
jgi:hypothetical protein